MRAIFILIITWSLFSTADQRPEKTVMVVKGMVCSFCAQGIEKKLKAFKEIKNVQVDLDTKKVEIEYQPGQKLAPEVLQKVIKDAGYDVVE